MLPDDNLAALFHDNRRSGYLYQSFSTENDRTWSKSIRTNFLDVTSKIHGLRSKSGHYVLVSNANPPETRSTNYCCQQRWLAVYDNGIPGRRLSRRLSAGDRTRRLSVDRFRWWQAKHRNSKNSTVRVKGDISLIFPYQIWNNFQSELRTWFNREGSKK